MSGHIGTVSPFMHGLRVSSLTFVRQRKKNLGAARLQISTSNLRFINNTFSVKVDSVNYSIRVIEEFACSCQLKVDAQISDGEESESCWESDGEGSRDPAPAIFDGSSKFSDRPNKGKMTESAISDARGQEQVPKKISGLLRDDPMIPISREHSVELTQDTRMQNQESVNAKVIEKCGSTVQNEGSINGPNLQVDQT